MWNSRIDKTNLDWRKSGACCLSWGRESGMRRLWGAGEVDVSWLRLWLHGCENVSELLYYTLTVLLYASYTSMKLIEKKRQYGHHSAIGRIHEVHELSHYWGSPNPPTQTDCGSKFMIFFRSRPPRLLSIKVRCHSGPFLSPWDGGPCIATIWLERKYLKAVWKGFDQDPLDLVTV